MPDPTLSPQPQTQPPASPPASDPPAETGGADGGKAAAPPTLLGGGGTAGAADPAAAGEPSAGNAWDAWRTDISGGDEALARELARLKTPADLGKAYAEQRKALSKRAEPPKLAPDATPEQIAEFRKLTGVPESPDKYGLAPPQGYEATEVEKAMLGEFAKAMHAKHVPTAAVKEAADQFFRAQAANRQALNQLDAARQREWQGDLRQKLGKDYDHLIAAGDAFLSQRFAENPEAKSVLLNARLPGGGRLGDHPAFIEMVADLALNNGFTDRIEASDIERSGGKSLAEQQREIETLQFKDRDRYNLPDIQARLNKIIELRLSRGEIDDQGNETRRRRAG